LPGEEVEDDGEPGRVTVTVNREATCSLDDDEASVATVAVATG